MIHALVLFVRSFFRDREELPSFTVDLDDSEARWNREQKDEWDREFEAAKGFLPAFSDLEAERIKVLSDAQRESETRRSPILSGLGSVGPILSGLGSVG